MLIAKRPNIGGSSMFEFSVINVFHHSELKLMSTYYSIVSHRGDSFLQEENDRLRFRQFGQAC